MTAKQKANRERFKKVVAEAKKLRSKNPKLSQAQAVKQAWAIMYSKTGTSKKVGAVKKKTTKKVAKKKATVKSYHKDTKSHNVNIRVISGMGDIGENFTRINNDVNGNPRYVVHFLDIINEEERMSIPFTKLYDYAIKKAKKIGGKKYSNKSYGGGIVFQSYNIEDTWNKIQKLKHTPVKIKF